MWAQLFNVGIGVWLVFAPAVLAYGPAASDNSHITGPVIATFATIACWEFMRGMRKWNYIPGIWLIMAPWILGYDDHIAMWVDVSCGILVLVFSSIEGRKRYRYNGGWEMLWK